MTDPNAMSGTEDIFTGSDGNVEPAKKSGRGFASMDPEKRRAIASKGGKTSHMLGTAHRFTSEEARVAGSKGGNAPHASRGRVAKKEVVP